MNEYKQVKQLCDASQPCALHTVIRRAIITPGSRNVTGQLLDLIGSILRIAGIPSTEISSSARALMKTFTKTKTFIDDGKNGKMNQDIADFVSDMITMHISSCVDKISAANAGVGGRVKQLEADIASLKSSASSLSVAVTASNGVGTLVAKRDVAKNLAQKHSNIIKIKMSTAPTTDGSNGTADSKEANSKDEMMAKVFGEQYDEMVASKQKYDDLKNRQGLSKSSVSAREAVVSKITSLKNKKVKASEKIMELELEMKRLNADLNTYEQELEKEEVALSALDNSLSAEEKEIESQMEKVSQNMRINDSVSNVVESLQNFQEEMTKVTSNELSSIQSKIPKTDVKVDLPMQMKAYISSMKDYFDSELRLVSYLQRRANKLRDGFPRMVSKLERIV